MLNRNDLHIWWKVELDKWKVFIWVWDCLFMSLRESEDDFVHKTFWFDSGILLLPEFLENTNVFDRESRERRWAVELPPWARNPVDLCKNRATLESPYVTQHLSEWIDLMFGSKSRGKAALEADNLYHPNFYESALTETVLNSSKELSFLQDFVVCFGQAPRQLFTKQHSCRVPMFQSLLIRSSSQSCRRTRRLWQLQSSLNRSMQCLLGVFWVLIHFARVRLTQLRFPCQDGGISNAPKTRGFLSPLGNGSLQCCLRLITLCFFMPTTNWRKLKDSTRKGSQHFWHQRTTS